MRKILLLLALAAMIIVLTAVNQASAGSRHHDFGDQQFGAFVGGVLQGLLNPPQYQPQYEYEYYEGDNYDYQPRRNQSSRNNLRLYEQELRDIERVCRQEKKMLQQGIRIRPRCQFENQQ